MDDDEIKLSEIFFIRQKIANKRVVLLVGPKESGKTTFLYYLNGLGLNKQENDQGEQTLVLKQKQRQQQFVLKQFKSLKIIGKKTEDSESILIRVTHIKENEEMDDVSFALENFLLFNILKYASSLRIVLVLSYEYCLDTILMKNFIQSWETIITQQDENNFQEISAGTSLVFSKLADEDDRDEFSNILEGIEEQLAQNLTFTEAKNENRVDLFMNQDADGEIGSDCLNGIIQNGNDIETSKMSFYHGFKKYIDLSEEKKICVSEKFNGMLEKDFLQYTKTSMEVFTLTFLLYLAKQKKKGTPFVQEMEQLISKKLKDNQPSGNFQTEIPKNKIESAIQILYEVSKLLNGDFQVFELFIKLFENKTIQKMKEQNSYFRQSIQLMENVQSLLIYYNFYIDLKNKSTQIISTLMESFTKMLRKLRGVSDINPDLLKNQKFTLLQEKYGVGQDEAELSEEDEEYSNEQQYRRQKISQKIMKKVESISNLQSETKKNLQKDHQQLKKLLYKVRRVKKQQQRKQILQNLKRLLKKYTEWEYCALVYLQIGKLTEFKQFLVKEYLGLSTFSDQANRSKSVLKKIIFLLSEKKKKKQEEQMTEIILKICFNQLLAEDVTEQSDFEILFNQEDKIQQKIQEGGQTDYSSMRSSKSLIKKGSSDKGTNRQKKQPAKFFCLERQEESQLLQRVKKKQLFFHNFFSHLPQVHKSKSFQFQSTLLN